MNLAPNGKPSNLNPEQYRLVRTPAFKKWFGNWEYAYITGDYKNTSKVVDSNGEPLVVYHSTGADFNVFNSEWDIGGGDYLIGIHFGTKKQAEFRAKIISSKRLIPAFLKINNLRRTKDEESMGTYEWAEVLSNLGIDVPKNINHTGIFKILKANKIDGFVYKNEYEGIEKEDSFIVFDSSQIKLADGTNTTFDSNNPDIRYAEGGGVEEKLYRNTSIDWLNDFLKKGITYPYINKKRFISFSKEEDSGGADNFGETNIEFNAKELYKQGAIEIEYNVDFFEQNPEICKYVTGYKGEEDYYQQRGYEGKQDFEENGQDDFDTLMWETVIEDFENEAEVVIKKLKYKDGLILSVNGEKFENYKFNEVGHIENLFLQNGFTEDELQRILEENENYFKQIEFYDNETLIIYRTIALPKKLVDKFIKLDKKAIGDGIGEYWTLDKEFGRSVWGGGHYEGEETFDVTCVGHLKIKDIDWEMMKYAFNDDPYNFGSESEIRGVNGGNYIKIVGCQDTYKNGGGIEEPTEFWGESAAGVLLICKKTNRVLLFHRSEDVYEPETWGIISGKIDYDENPKDAVLRELVEETKFSKKEVKSIVLKPSYIYKKGSFTFYNYLGFVDSEFTPILNWENTDYKWCDIGDYPQPLHFGVSLLLKNIDLKKELYKKTIKKRLLAPNGKPTNLTPEQYKIVRTPEFKAWFGDWENSPETASKVIDSNGEPLVVYHGTIKDFSIFSFDKLGSGIKANLGYLGIYFTDDKTLATDFTRIKWTNPNSKFKKGSKVYEVFLKIKNPKYMTIDGFILMDNKNRSEESIKNVRKDLLKKGYDGIIVEKAQLYWQSKMREFDGKQYIILQNNKNIKLADGTNTTFDSNNPDIRYVDGGSIPDLLSSQEVEYKLGRELHWWNDDIVYLSGIEYKKVYLRPEYKKVIE